MRHAARLLIAALTLALMAVSARADSVTYTLDVNVGSFGALNPPSPTGPWATATFTQIDPFQVVLDLHALPGLGDSFINAWGFNSDIATSDLTIAPIDAATAVKVAAVLAPDTFFEPPSEPVYDFGFIFYDSAFMVTPPYYFGIYYLPEDPTFLITSSVPIAASDFFTTGATAPLYTEALIKDTNGGVWGASVGPALGSAAIPAPSAAIGGLVLMIGLGVWKMIQRSAQAA